MPNTQKIEKKFNPNTLESSFDALVCKSRNSDFEQASQILKELPRDAILQNKQNDAVLQINQEEEEK